MIKGLYCGAALVASIVVGPMAIVFLLLGFGMSYSFNFNRMSPEEHYNKWIKNIKIIKGVY